MLSFLKKNQEPTVTDTPDTKPAKAAAMHPLDGLTGGAFSAPTSGDRAAKVREWLATNPSPEQMAEVFKELSSKDKGAAKPLREKLDEIKRSSAQEHIAAEWADKANALLALGKLNIADALAWQRDAAKAGAPLSKEPLASVKVQLAERVKLVEDLQHRVQVQREAALLMAQRIEVLSTKPLADAQTAWEGLRTDVTLWQSQTDAMAQDVQWPSIDAKFGPQLDTAKAQLLTLWGAFEGALAQAVAALGDAAAPLPQVPVWADAIRAARGEALPKVEKVVKPKIDPEIRSKSTTLVRELLAKLEHELAEGHGKASVSAANDVRNALKEHGANVGDKLESAAQHALAAAGELEGWQRWRANQIREELIVRAQELVAKPLGGRKQQDAVRQLRDAWKQTDQGGIPNHSMWKHFDDACNTAYKLVEAWLEKVKAEEGAHKAQRLVLIEQINAWTADNAHRTDWKEVNRELHNMSEAWRTGGHVGEKTFAELQQLYKAAIKVAHGPLEVAQTASLARRHAMIEESNTLAAAPMLRIDAVKSLQQRWQAEAQSVPMDRKQEQKLWDAFRKPIDDAFNRKSAEREQASAAVSAQDKVVLDAVKALDEANASGDAGRIRAAMAALEAAARGEVTAAAAPAAGASALVAASAQTPAPADSQAATDAPAATETDAMAEPGLAASADAVLEQKEPVVHVEPAQAATENVASESSSDASPEASSDASADTAEPAAVPAAPAAPVKVAKPVIAMRSGDDRPGAKKAEPQGRSDGRPGGRFGDKPGDKKGGNFGDRAGRDGGRPAQGRDGDPRGGRIGERGAPRGSDRGADRGTERGNFGDDRFADRGPRLSNTAFYAQRDALERAQQSLKKLAAQAHGEHLTALITAWEQRSAEGVPSAALLGKSVSPAARTAWSQAVSKPAAGDAATALLRMEMAADVPTPAEHISARRMLQLQLLTKRNEAAPVDTWALDTTAVLSTAHDPANAKRLQTALKALLR
jgi:ATP-dependent RNA helicase SUPV3L1/SUV3